MEKIYYIVVNGSQEGPYSKEELRIRNLAPSTLIWRAGMPQWVAIADLQEVADILPIDITGQYPDFSAAGNAAREDNGWFAMVGDRRVGPGTVSELIAAGVGPDTPVWHPGMADWSNASSQREFNEKFSSINTPNFGQNPQYGQQQYPNFGQNPQYGQQQYPNFGQNPQYGQQQYPNYGQNPQYGQQQPNYEQSPRYGQQQPNYGQNPQYGQNRRNDFGNQNPFGGQPGRTNWLPWAIGATVVGFMFSCIGAIFGIIGIVQANKANGLYTAGFDTEGDQANNTAKTMTIIGYVLAGIGLIATGYLFKNPSFYQFF